MILNDSRQRAFISLKRILGFYFRMMQRPMLYRKLARLMRVTIQMKEATEEEMREIHRWLSPDIKQNISYNKNVTNLIAKEGTQIIGFVQLVRYFKAVSYYQGYWLFGLKVRLMYHRMGIGETLTNNVIKMAREEGALDLSLAVYEDNYEAIKLYHKLGFKIKLVPGLEEQFEKEKLLYGRRRIVMNKNLIG